MPKMVRLAAVGDLHCSKTSQGTLQPIFAKAADAAEMLLLAGDLTDYGLPEEARILAKELASVRMPVLAVLGNHDYESSKCDEVRRILVDAGMTILDGDACETHGVGVAGVKGFGGGFGQRALGSWGEATIKQFVRETVEETLKLETALARIGPVPLVAVLHYAPITQTIEGEPLEIYPFLGSSRLEEPLNTYKVSLVVHSHAHRGRLEGRTSTGIPVYNVSMPLLARSFADRPPFRVFEIALGDVAEVPTPATADQIPAPPILVRDASLPPDGRAVAERHAAGTDS